MPPREPGWSRVWNLWAGIPSLSCYPCLPLLPWMPGSVPVGILSLKTAEPQKNLGFSWDFQPSGVFCHWEASRFHGWECWGCSRASGRGHVGRFSTPFSRMQLGWGVGCLGWGVGCVQDEERDLTGMGNLRERWELPWPFPGLPQLLLLPEHSRGARSRRSAFPGCRSCSSCSDSLARQSRIF